MDGRCPFPLPQGITIPINIDFHCFGLMHIIEPWKGFIKSDSTDSHENDTQAEKDNGEVVNHAGTRFYVVLTGNRSSANLVLRVRWAGTSIQ
jgi:hypothetical protein